MDRGKPAWTEGGGGGGLRGKPARPPTTDGGAVTGARGAYMAACVSPHHRRRRGDRRLACFERCCACVAACGLAQHLRASCGEGLREPGELEGGGGRPAWAHAWERARPPPTDGGELTGNWGAIGAAAPA